MTQPHRPKQGIIPLLIQEKLPRMPQSRVNFSISIYVGRYHPGAGEVVEVKDAAFADVYKEAEVILTSVIG